MRIVIAGGTGFLGSPLAEVYAEDGHDVRVLSRGVPPGESRHDPGTGMPGITRVGWNPGAADAPWAFAVDGADAVVNLAGESLDGGRWTPERKTRIRESRLGPTRHLAAAIGAARVRPPVFVSASGVGYYGPAGDDQKTEAAPPGHDFLADICKEWEAAARSAESPATRVVLVRSGMVLERSGGALAKMLTPFRFGVGGRLGSGRQYMSWIHRIDWVELVRWAIESPSITGPLNATAPVPVTNREFTKALGRALHRPAIMPVPSFALKLAFGEMAQSLILTGQRALPARACASGFHFRYPEIDLAFRGIFGEG